MKAFSESSPALAGQAGPILLLTEKSAASARHGHDEHSQTDILTSGFEPRSRLPGADEQPVAVGVCSPLQWRNRPRFSRGSLTPGYDEDGPIVHRFQRTHDC